MKRIKLTSIMSIILILILMLSACSNVNDTATASKEPPQSASPGSQFNKPSPEVPAEKGDNVRMIVSKASGRTLTDTQTGVIGQAYNFEKSQTWMIEGDESSAKIKNMLSGKYLEANGSGLIMADASDSNAQVWIIEEIEAGFKAIKNASAETYLLATDGGEMKMGEYTEETSRVGQWRLMDVYVRDIEKADASWLEGKFGVMTHLLPGASDFKKLAEKHDAKAIAAQLKEVGAQYYILSIGQNTGYWNTENEVYASMLTQGPKNRFTAEDIISEMAAELKKEGIKLIAYITSLPSASNIDPKFWGFNRGSDGQFHMNMENCMLWAMTLQEWADKYGDLVDGWWIDGCYSWYDFTNQTALLYSNALKHGNPNAIIAYNSGIYLEPYVSCEEYVTGETDHPFGDDNPSMDTKSSWLLPTANTAPKFDTGSQWFMLTYIGKWWGDPQIRYTPELWAELTYEIVTNKGSICLDVPHDANKGYVFTDEAMDILRAVRDKVKVN